jgi:hypothetical protein
MTITKVSVANDLRLTPQAKTVLTHLRAGKPLTPMKALTIYGISRLAACIYEIRKAGYTVNRIHRQDEMGHKYSKYLLETAETAVAA